MTVDYEVSRSFECGVLFRFRGEGHIVTKIVYPRCERVPVSDGGHHAAIQTKVVATLFLCTFLADQVTKTKTTHGPHAFDFLTFLELPLKF